MPPLALVGGFESQSQEGRVFEGLPALVAHQPAVEGVPVDRHASDKLSIALTLKSGGDRWFVLAAVKQRVELLFHAAELRLKALAAFGPGVHGVLLGRSTGAALRRYVRPEEIRRAPEACGEFFYFPLQGLGP